MFEILDSKSVPALWERRAEIFKADRVDLKDTREIDSAGIAFLVQWAKALPQGRLTILNAPDNAVRLIATFKLQPLLQVQ